MVSIKQANQAKNQASNQMSNKQATTTASTDQTNTNQTKNVTAASVASTATDAAADSQALAHQIAADLLRIKAVTLSPQAPFTWASGLKSPIYTDNRLTISYPAIRQRIAQGLATMIQQLYPQVDVIAGTATAGIPHAAIVATLLDLPLIYIRSQPKDHGQGRQIEGQLATNSKVVVIDDLISTGGSVLQAVQAAQREGAQVLGVVGIFSYQLPVSQANFVAADLHCTTLTNYTSLIETAVDQGYISAQDREILQQWRQDPQAWGTQFAD